ncbi:MAG: LPS export ABC transporter permease LptG [Rhizobiales bacterium]|jgi:lipopolysaccharide export system permease protein|nr:LPS export ABC transporter permease LptG [Hyphomicrobiales bacterium]OJU37091.1 MAG: LPS export ABC transporter permease LptG [Rhizobiales bacterium 68-8]
MMSTLSRYLFRRHLMMVVQVMAAIVVVAYLVDFTEFARRAGGWPSYTVAKGLYLSAMRMPMIAMLVWPFVALLAAIGVLMSLNRRYELVVARSVGVSAWQFLAPLCLASFLVGTVAVTVVNPVAAWSLSAVEELEMTFRGWAPDRSDELAVPWFSQDAGDGGITIIGADRTARHGQLLGDAVFLQVDAGGNLVERYDARTATLEAGHWHLEDVRRTFGDRQKEVLEAADLPTELRPEFVEQQLAAPQATSVYELPGKVRVARALGLQPNRFAMQFHSLMALPMLMVAMTLIAATVSLRFARMGQSASVILGGILAGFLLYVALVVFTAFGNVGFIPPVLAAWVPVVVAMFFGVTFLLHREDG